MIDKLLLISYFWPPLGGIPPRRSLKLAKALSEKGIDITVLTTSNRLGWELTDETLLNETERVRVIRSPSFGTEALNPAYKSWSKLFKLLCIKIANVFFTDYMFWWNFTLLPIALKLIRKEKFKFVYNSAPPFSPLFTTYLLKKRFPSLVVILDLRDSLLSFPGIFRVGLGLKNKLRFRTASFWEKRLIKHIDIFFTVSPGIRTEYLSRYPFLKGKVFEIITNGYDPADWSDIPSYTPTPLFKITYTGGFPLFRSPRCFLRGFELAAEKEPELAKRSRIIFAGRLKPEDLAYINNFKYRGLVELKGFLPHKKALELQATSDVNLLVIAPYGSGAVLTGKIFEYIRAGRPILAVAPDGEVSKLMIEGKLGPVAHPEKPEEIKGAILTLFRKWEENHLYINPPHGFVERFSWDNLAEDFLNAIEGWGKGS